MAGARQLAQRRGVGLIRVSKARGREDLISPELQRTAIEGYAQRKQVQIIDWVEALDESGSQEKSPWWKTLETVIARVEAGEIDVVVVWKFSRAARHRKRWALAIDRIEVAGALLESATEDVDTSTSTGRLTRGMLAELAAWEAEVRGEGWKEVKERRARLGLGDGQPRFGYVIVNRAYTPDPETAPLVQACYERAVEGESFRTLARWLNAQGVRTPKGTAWEASALRESLRNGFPAGLIRYGGELLPGQHEPIINVALWERFQQARGRQRTSRSTARKHLFSGLLRCAYCGSLLYAYGAGPNIPAGTKYRCGSKDRKDVCPGGGVFAWAPKVRAEISVWLAQLVANQQGEYERRVQVWRKRPKINVTPLRRALVRVETDLLALAKKNLDGFYDDTTYLMLRAELLDKQTVLTKQIEEAEQAQPRLIDYRPVQQVWDSALDDTERRHALTLVLSHVLVRRHADGPKYEPVPLWVDTT